MSGFPKVQPGSLLLPGAPLSYIVISPGGGTTTSLTGTGTTVINNFQVVDQLGSDLALVGNILTYVNAGWYIMYAECDIEDTHVASGTWPDLASAHGKVRFVINKPNAGFAFTAMANWVTFQPPPIGQAGDHWSDNIVVPPYFKAAGTTQSFAEYITALDHGTVFAGLNQYVARIA